MCTDVASNLMILKLKCQKARIWQNLLLWYRYLFTRRPGPVPMLFSNSATHPGARGPANHRFGRLRPKWILARHTPAAVVF